MLYSYRKVPPMKVLGLLMVIFNVVLVHMIWHNITTYLAVIH